MIISTVDNSKRVYKELAKASAILHDALKFADLQLDRPVVVLLELDDWYRLFNQMKAGCEQSEMFDLNAPYRQRLGRISPAYGTPEEMPTVKQFQLYGVIYRALPS